MLVLGVGGELAVALVNALLLALWAVLPSLLFGYIGLSLAIRRLRPEFSLRKSEAGELDRAVALYETVCSRIEAIKLQVERPSGFWRRLLAGAADIPERHADEIEDLDAHAQHLRVTIVRLKRQPLQRLRAWVHMASTQFALGRAVIAHVLVLALLIVGYRVSDQPAWADELTTRAQTMLAWWFPLDERLFYANAVATGFAALAVALFYVVRRMGLRRDYAVEFCTFKELAHADPGQAIHLLQSESEGPQAESDTADANLTGLAILGLPATATMEQIKAAYKTLIKQNHPDRVHGMSPAFRRLAEAETKRLNAAYQQALISLSSV